MHSSMAKTSKERKILVYGGGKDHHKIIKKPRDVVTYRPALRRRFYVRRMSVHSGELLVADDERNIKPKDLSERHETRSGVLSDEPVLRNQHRNSGSVTQESRWPLASRRGTLEARQSQTKPSKSLDRRVRASPHCERRALHRWAWRSNVASSCGVPKHRWDRSNWTCPRISHTWVDSPAAAGPSWSPWSIIGPKEKERAH